MCKDCHITFLDKEGLASHAHQKHSVPDTGRQLQALLEISERPIDEAQVEMCPFCYGKMSLKRLLSHMAEHMEQLALFSLPLADKEDEEAKSIRTDKIQSGFISAVDTSIRDESLTAEFLTELEHEYTAESLSSDEVDEHRQTPGIL